MIRHELYKLITTKGVAVMLVAVFVINVALLWWFEKDKTSYKAYEYTALWEELDAIAEQSGWTKAVEELENRLSELDTTGLKKEEIQAIRSRADYYKKELYEEVLEEISFQQDYIGYLESVDKKVKQYSAMTIFGNADSFVYRDLMKMQKAYAGIERIELTPAPSSGVEMAASSGVTDILALVVLLFIAVTVWLKEKEQNIMLLLRTAYRGRLSLAGSKLALVVMACVFVGVGLYGCNIIVAMAMFGLGDLNRPLASVCDYGHTLWEITAGEFLLLNMFFKIMAYIWVMLLISVVCCRLSRTITAFGGIVAAGAVSCLMYYKISPFSKYMALKYLNPFALLKTELLLKEYNSLKFFEYPVDYRLCIAVLLIFGIIVFALLVLKLFTAYVIRGVGRIKSMLIRIVGGIGRIFVWLRRITERHTILCGHELYRIFICHGAMLALIVFALFIANDSKTYSIAYSGLSNYYRDMYIDILEGPLTDEKLAYIEEEEEYAKTVSGDEGKAQQTALTDIRDKVSYIEENEGACFVNEDPHKIIMSVYHNRRDILHALLCMLAVALVMPCFFAPDLQTGMYKLTEITRYGRRRLSCMRYMMGTVLAIIVALTVHMLYFRQVIVAYDVDSEVFSYPINSIENFKELGSTMSIGTYYIIIYVLKVIFTVCGAFLIYGLSRLIKSQAFTTLAGFVVLAGPMVAALYDGRLEIIMYPFSAALGNLFVKDVAAAVTCMVTVVIVAVVLRVVFKKRAKNSFTLSAAAAAVSSTSGDRNG